MGRKSGSQKKDSFSEALAGKNIPVLTLDHKWYRLLDELGRKASKEAENALNQLLRRQGKLNTESKNIKRLKKKLMNEIVPMADEANQSKNAQVEKRLEEHKRLIAECNERLEQYQDELMELPREIKQRNYELMMLTMEYCYDIMLENIDAVEEIEEWVTGVRIELKKQLIRKQEMEQRNHEIYSYMHDIFGAEVVNLFDMKYNPEQYPRMPGETTKKSDK